MRAYRKFGQLRVLAEQVILVCVQKAHRGAFFVGAPSKVRYVYLSL